MKALVEIIVKVVNGISFVGLLVLIVLGAMYELMGDAKFSRLFNAIGVTISLKEYWIISSIIIALFFITLYIKEKV